MLERDGYPAGVPCFVTVAEPDPQAAAAFYGGLFGWTCEERMPPGGPGSYLAARLDGRDVAGITSQRDGAAAPPAWATYIAVDSADATAATALEAGGSVLAEPFDIFEAGRSAMLADPAGATFFVWQAGEHKGAQVVNAPGSWNWSNLSAGDVEGAKAFYGAVFGWEPRTVSFGEEESTMWSLPGYAEALEARDPGLRRRHAEAGAPEGFSDAVAWLVRDEDPPPRWAVTFAVDGTDAAAERAVQLGGTVVVAPFDAGPTRVAVLADPQ
ncbi:MAG: VOC family protein, partial [Solirubrobacteraceae bacterium]